MAANKGTTSPSKTKTKNKGGRPTTYSPELAAEICEHLSIGESLRTVCSPAHMPSVATIFNWFRAYPEFLEQYTRAKQESADAMAEDILDISDDATNDWMLKHGHDDKEYWQLNGEHIQRSRLRVESRKWLMAKMKPKVYGDKLDLTTGGDKIARGMSLEEIDAVLARAETADEQPDNQSHDLADANPNPDTANLPGAQPLTTAPQQG